MPFRHLFILTDIEGAAGVTSWRQTREDGAPLLDARRLLTGEVNAFIDGVFQGAGEQSVETKISVWDGHGYGGLDFDLLDSRCKSYTQEGEPSFADLFTRCSSDPVPVDGLVFIGQHAMEGRRGNLAHTYSSRRIREHRINDIPVGEFGARSTLAWALGVPTVFFSGDDVACDEAKEWVPGIALAVVKQARGIEAADCLSAEESRALLRKSGEEVIRTDPTDARWKPARSFEPPYSYRISYKLYRGIIPRWAKVRRAETLPELLSRA
ncbi:MAG: hypothetical protein GY937_26420 [bacterium]|nr:hypothetical protein [bacterium]